MVLLLVVSVELTSLLYTGWPKK